MDPNPVKVWILNLAWLFDGFRVVFLKTNKRCSQVVVGSEDLAANHDVLQIVEVKFFTYLCIV